MRIRLNNPTLLLKAVEIVSELVTEVRLKVNEFGMRLVAIDPANVAMVGFKIPKSAFSEFEASDDVLGINLEDFKRILKRCGTKSSLILEHKENVLNIRIEDRILRNFSLMLINVDSEDKEIPTTLEFSSRVELNSTDFIDSIEDCTVVAEACSFIIQDNKFIIESKGINSARSEFSGDEAQINAEDCKARYSLEYLSKFLKGSKICDKTVLNFARNNPLKIELRTDGLELVFILAPRVETED